MHISPIIINVAVPLLKHSPRLGQDASSHTEASLCCLSLFFMCLIFGEVGIFTRIQSGFAGNSVVGITLIGIRRTLSAPRSFSPSIKMFRRFFSDITISCSLTNRIVPCSLIQPAICCSKFHLPHVLIHQPLRHGPQFV